MNLHFFELSRLLRSIDNFTISHHLFTMSHLLAQNSIQIETEIKEWTAFFFFFFFSFSEKWNICMTTKYGIRGLSHRDVPIIFQRWRVVSLFRVFYGFPRRRGTVAQELVSRDGYSSRYKRLIPCLVFFFFYTRI